MVDSLPVIAPAPVDRVGRGWIARFTLVWFGYWMAWLVPIQLLLPDQLASVDPTHKVFDFAVINGVAGLVALIALPVCGALCDHTRSRLGRRRIWVLAGIAVFALGVAAAGPQSSWLGLAACWQVAALGNSMACAGLTAAVADQVPPGQRGVVSGAMFGPQAVGILVGLVLVTTVFTSGVAAYLMLAFVLLASAIPFVSRYRESPGRPGALSARAIARGLWVSPTEHPDFAWAFAARLLVNIGNALGTTYLLYFFTDDLRLADPDTALLITIAVYLVFTVLATYLGGLASDRLGRRRVFVAAASCLQALAALLLAALPGFDTALVGAALLGAGYGAFLSVDQALVVGVLPEPESRAKDLGIMNIGNVVPQSLAPLVAGVVVIPLGGYPLLFGAAGVITLLGAALVYRVRSVR